MPKLKLLEMEVGSQLIKSPAVLHDGFILSSDSATRIRSSSVFLWSPPIECSVEELLNMAPPPAYMGDCDSAVLKFRHDWLPLFTPTEDRRERDAQGRREALALIRMHRQKTVKKTMNEQHRSMSDAFKYLAIATGVIAVAAVVIVGLLLITKGTPV